MHTSVAKVSPFKVSNVNKVFLRNGINWICMSFLSIYTFIILTMRLCAQHNSWPKRTEWSEDLIITNTRTAAHHHVTFLNLYLDIQSNPAVIFPWVNELVIITHTWRAGSYGDGRRRRGSRDVQATIQEVGRCLTRPFQSVARLRHCLIQFHLSYYYSPLNFHLEIEK